MPDQPAGLSVTLEKLAEFLDLTTRRVRQLLDEGHVVRASDGKNFEFLPSVKGYIAYLQQAAQGKAVSDEAKDKQSAQTSLLQTQRDHAQHKLDVARRDLIPAEEHRGVCVRLIKILSDGADSLPDRLERSVGLSGDALESVRSTTDGWRMRLYETAVEVFVGQQAPADLVRPAASVTPVRAVAQPLPDLEQDVVLKRKPGRPRKKSTDTFTPELI